MHHHHEPSIWESLFDPSVLAALVGAFAAYLLVMATDVRRHYRRLKLLRRRITIQKENVIELRQDLAKHAARVEKDEFSSYSMMPYPVSEIRQLAGEVSDKLETDEWLAIDNICFNFESIQNLAQSIFNRTLTVIENRNTEDQQIKQRMIEEIKLIKNAYLNIDVIFEKLIWALDIYTAGEYSKFRDYTYEDDESQVD